MKDIHNCGEVAEERLPFRYLTDPAFLVCVAVYFTNRQLESYDWGYWLTTYYLNDFTCFAFWMPI